MHILRAWRLAGKTILLIDPAHKKGNDRTWCFWEKHDGVFEEAVRQRYSSLWFHGGGYSALSDISPYEYKMIRSADFYRHCFKVIDYNASVRHMYGRVERCHSDKSGTYVVVDGEQIRGDFIFNSVPFEEPQGGPNRYYLKQHFLGWFVKTEAPSFDPKSATLMDFRVSQEKGPTFVYVMPMSEREALIEYTIFSKEVAEEQDYQAGLVRYCGETLGLRNYTISETEKGVIPMTNFRFEKRRHNIVNIGAAGGLTKASTGYTFRFIQRHSERIVRALVDTGKPFLREPPFAQRFNWYDSTLLNILYNDRLSGEEIFSTIMKNNKMSDVLTFLDNASNPLLEWKIIRHLPRKTFLNAALRQLF